MNHCGRVTLFLLAVAVLGAACSGDSGSHATPPSTRARTPTSVPVVKPTPEPSPNGLIPARPGSIEEYPAAIVAYLNKAGDAAVGEHCLADLLAAWQMPDGNRLPPVGHGRCVLGNVDNDPANEVVVSLSAQDQQSAPLSTELVVFHHAASGYEVAYISPPGNGKTDVPYEILSSADLTGDGVGDLAFAGITCGAHTCTWHVHVVTGRTPGYRELTPKDGLMLATAEVTFEDVNGDGLKDIVMHGGIIQSVGAGPQRAITDVYAWDGQQFSLVRTQLDPSDLRYFKVVDADAAFAAGDYTGAIDLFQQALTDPALQDVQYVGSRDELMAYALFRTGISYLKLGDTYDASRQIEEAIATYPVSLDGKAAVEFRNAVNLTQVGAGDLSAGCRAVIAFATQNRQRFNEVWNYGYANPGFDPAKFCPF